MCEIDYVEDQQSVQIILGLFIDDLAYTLEKNAGGPLHIASNSEVADIDQQYETYLRKHFKITVNEHARNYTYIGKEYDDDIVRFYLEITDVTALKHLAVHNQCLLRDFDSQLNIVKLQVKDFHKTWYLNKKNLKGVINF
jgi:hypothetical protein